MNDRNFETTYKERASEFTKESSYDITNGIPFKDSNELNDFLIQQYITGHSRHPILGMKDGKVFIQTQLIDTESQHSALLSKLKGYLSTDIQFGTGIEGVLGTEPSRGMYLELTDPTGKEPIAYWIVKPDSDSYGKSIRTEKAYIEKLRQIFKIPGVNLIDKDYRY
ncbi:MAG: hypothetical protein ACMG57_00080 [Candidatus Dojkabacteria bacterium]